MRGRLGLATRLAITMMIEGLNEQETVTVEGMARPTGELIGKFRPDAKAHVLEKTDAHAWRVDPVLVGEGRPLNKEAVIALRDNIIQNPENHPRFTDALATLGPEVNG